MADVTVTNWFGDIVSHPKVVVEATSAADIAAILENPAQYPSPVRAVGSNHSGSPCGVAEGGTLIKMAGMNRILDIGENTVTAQGGAIAIDLAQELDKHKLQFFVNTEIGNLSVGSAACAGTKDASMPGEFGQVGSYITRIQMVLPSGDTLEVTDAQPELMQLVRSSYGLFGIVTEATYQVRPVVPLAVHHKTFSLADFVAQLPELKALGYSMMYYLFPFQDLITVEFRKYNPGATGEPNRHIWPLRNYLWATAGPAFSARVDAEIADHAIRYKVLDGFGDIWRYKLENVITSQNTVATDQIIRYPSPSNDSRYTFSLSAFPEDTFPKALLDYAQFCKQYQQEKNYRANVIHVGYRVLQDQKSLLSYSYDGNVMTIDPVSTNNPGWTDFLLAYNQFSSDHGGIPLPNQTPLITRAQVEKALGDRWKKFAAARKTYDPNNRLLNGFFRELLGEAS